MSAHYTAVQFHIYYQVSVCYVSAHGLIHYCHLVSICSSKIWRHPLCDSTSHYWQIYTYMYGRFGNVRHKNQCCCAVFSPTLTWIRTKMSKLPTRTWLTEWHIICKNYTAHGLVQCWLAWGSNVRQKLLLTSRIINPIFIINQCFISFPYKPPQFGQTQSSDCTFYFH